MRELAPNVWQLGGFPPNAINVYLVGDVLIDAGTHWARRQIFPRTRWPKAVDAGPDPRPSRPSGRRSDDLLQAAVERKIEMIGEAAGHVSEEFRQANLQIPWAKIRGQRHVLAHDYGRIEHDRIWSVVTVHLPDLISQIRPLLPTEGSGFDA